MMEKQRSLNALQIPHLTTAINRSHILIHSFLLSLFLSHRLCDAVSAPPLLLLLILTELSLSLYWLIYQPFCFRPVTRTAFIHRLPEDDSQLPALDVLICTADPNKEPTVEVMNTLVSAMSLDYPPGKLHVYLSDDGGAEVTLSAVKVAWGFATWWVPFCRSYNLSCRCPITYFGEKHDDQGESTVEFSTHRSQLKEKYEEFKERVEKILKDKSLAGSDNGRSRADHPQLVQVVNEESTDASMMNPNHADVPLLVYVAREKRPSCPHHFKAGALNALLRVSSVVSNSPVFLVLDCDMYCNDPTSAKQAMCFYLDKDISPSLSFVQFPQRFHNITKTDIYDSGLRMLFKESMPCMDGLKTGAFLCGTGFYMNRKAIYNIKFEGGDLVDLRNTFGTSNDLLMTLNQDIKQNAINISKEIAPRILQEANFLASCAYEKGTKWGKEVGFFYHSLLEDIFTGYNLHCRGWKSVYLNPERDPFLGTTTNNLNDVLTQNTRWSGGLAEIGLSRFCPFVYGIFGRRLPFLPCLCYSWCILNPLSSILYWYLAIIPQLCLLYGVSLYPKVSSKLFLVLALIFFSSQLKHLHGVLATGGTVVSCGTRPGCGR